MFCSFCGNSWVTRWLCPDSSGEVGLGGSHSTPSRNSTASCCGNLVTEKRSDHQHSEQKKCYPFSPNNLLIIRLAPQTGKNCERPFRERLLHGLDLHVQGEHRLSRRDFARGLRSGSNLGCPSSGQPLLPHGGGVSRPTIPCESSDRCPNPEARPAWVAGGDSLDVVAQRYAVMPVARKVCQSPAPSP
jgi:hypothetical protein